MHLDEMCVMELDFNLQVTHFPTGQKNQNCPQKLNSHHLTAVRQSFSAELNSAACHINCTQGSCTESMFSDAFCPTWKGRMKSFSQLPSHAAPASAMVWAAVQTGAHLAAELQEPHRSEVLRASVSADKY